MIRRSIQAISLVLLVAAATPAASGARIAQTTAACETTIRGKTWIIAPRGIDCDAGRKIVKTLAARTVPAKQRFRGRFAKMECLSLTRPGRLPTHLACGNPNGSRSLIAVQV